MGRLVLSSVSFYVHWDAKGSPPVVLQKTHPNPPSRMGFYHVAGIETLAASPFTVIPAVFGAYPSVDKIRRFLPETGRNEKIAEELSLLLRTKAVPWPVIKNEFLACSRLLGRQESHISMQGSWVFRDALEKVFHPNGYLPGFSF